MVSSGAPHCGRTENLRLRSLLCWKKSHLLMLLCLHAAGDSQQKPGHRNMSDLQDASAEWGRVHRTLPDASRPPKLPHRVPLRRLHADGHLHSGAEDPRNLPHAEAVHQLRTGRSRSSGRQRTGWRSWRGRSRRRKWLRFFFAQWAVTAAQVVQVCVLPEGVQEQRGNGEAGRERAALRPLCWLHEQVITPVNTQLPYMAANVTHWLTGASEETMEEDKSNKK